MDAAPAVRRLLGQARRVAARALGADAAPGDGLAVALVARLLFPGCSDLVPAELLAAVAPDGMVRDLSQVRRLLGASDAQNFPSPVTVRFGPEDLVERDFGRFRLVLDTADAGVAATLVTGRPWHPHLTAVFEQHVAPGATVLDVGANVGWFTMLAASLAGAAGRVIAVDPSSENCRLLLASAEANGFDFVEVWPFALDHRRGWAQFISHLGSNGGLIPPHPGPLAARAAPVVPVFPLDDLLGPDERIGFVKLDVEGAEHRVVQGGATTLERCRPVVVTELSPEMCRRISGVGPLDYVGWFTSRGWRVHAVARDGEVLPFSTAEALLDWWPDPMVGEDLLLVPDGS